MSKENYLPPGEREEILRAVEETDKEAEAARESGDQKLLLEKLERALYLARRLYPEASAEVGKACHQLCEVCNVAGTCKLAEGHLKGAQELLKRAEEVADKNQKDKALTWNNLACYYRRIGKLRIATTLLERALEIEEYAAPESAAQTHLNLCATLSQLNRHADALYHSQSAMIRMYEILSPLMVAQELSYVPLHDEERELVTVLCIAYHNTAVEHEYLKNFDGAIIAYSEGVRWAETFLGDNHQLIGVMKDSAQKVKEKLAKVKPGSAAIKKVDEMLSGQRWIEGAAKSRKNAKDFQDVQRVSLLDKQAGADNPQSTVNE